MTTNDEAVHVKVIREVMNHLRSISFNNTPPELSREVHNIVRKVTNSKDPYKKVKNQSNEMIKKLYPHLKKLVEEADDPLFMAVKLSIIGNVIDFGTSTRFSIEDMIDNIAEKEFEDHAYPKFKKTLDRSKTILYLADNAGEIFFDKLLLEEISKYDKDITFVVKANPIINDATMEDAEFAGVDKLATIIEGDAGQECSTPGIVLAYSTKELLGKIYSTDMMISKGQGNYESLSDIKREVFFMLVVKCPLVAQDIGEEMSKLILKVKE